MKLPYTIAAASFLALAPVLSEARELTVATAVPEASIYGERLANFAKFTAEKSGGDLTLKIHYSSALGDEQTVTRQVVRGRIDMAVVSTSGASLIAPELAMLLEPYIYQTSEQALCVLDNHAISVFQDALKEAGALSIGYMGVGAGAVFADQPVESPDQMKGLKIRATPTPPVQRYLQNMGASVVSAGVTDMIPMIKTGAINGADTAFLFGYAIGLPKLTEHLTLPGHIEWSGVSLISEKTWEVLSEEERDWLLTAEAEATALYHEKFLVVQKDLIAKTSEVSTVTVLSDIQRRAFQEIAEEGRIDAIASYGDHSDEIWVKLQSAVQACGV